MIVVSDGQVQAEKPALGDRPQFFVLHDNTQFTISLTGLIEKLQEARRQKQIAENSLGTETNDFGPAKPK